MTRDGEARDGAASTPDHGGHDEHGDGDRGWSGRETRTIHVRLTSEEYWGLRRRAHAAGLRPWDLARHWIISQLDRPTATPLDEPEGGLPDLESLVGLLFEQGGLLDDLMRRIDRVERVVGTQARRGEAPDMTPGAFPGRGSFGSTGSLRHPHPKLHDEILAVLHEANAPMTSEEIAERVTERGHYRARSGHNLTAAAISGRIANPRYRGLFRRDGRLIMPAVPATNRVFR